MKYKEKAAKHANIMEVAIGMCDEQSHCFNVVIT